MKSRTSLSASIALSSALGSPRRTPAAAVFFDAFIIRSILLPAVLELAGSLTWRFPTWFDRRLPPLAIDLPARSGGGIEEPLQPLTAGDFNRLT